MSESSGASFPGFGSEEFRKLPTTETVMGSLEIPQFTETPANTGPGEVSVRQASLDVPSQGDLG